MNLIDEVIITPKKPIYREKMDDIPENVFKWPHKNLIDEVEP